MDLKAPHGRILVKVDIDQKNWYTFSNGVNLRMERDVENLNRGYTQQVLGEVIDSVDIPKGAMILFHFNSIHDVNRVFNHTNLSGEEIASGIQIYSIRTEEVFLWKWPGEKKWKPTGVFETGLRVFKPYSGLLHGMEPTQIKNVIYVETGIYAGQVVRTLRACDFVVCFRGESGKDENVLRFRPYGDSMTSREPEVIAIDDELSEKVIAGEYLVGYEPSKSTRLELGN